MFDGHPTGVNLNLVASWFQVRILLSAYLLDLHYTWAILADWY